MNADGDLAAGIVHYIQQQYEGETSLVAVWHNEYQNYKGTHSTIDKNQLKGAILKHPIQKELTDDQAQEYADFACRYPFLSYYRSLCTPRLSLRNRPLLGEELRPVFAPRQLLPALL